MSDEVPDEGSPDQDQERADGFGPQWTPALEPQGSADLGPGDRLPGADETLSLAGDELAVTQPAAVVASAGVAESAVVVPTIQNPDVPRDYVPPVDGVDEVGSIPAVSARRAWARGQLGNWRLHLVRFVSAGVSVILAVVLVPGLSFTAWRWGQGLEIALIFGLLNTFVKPVLQFISLRFIFSSFGVVIVLINAFLMWLLSVLLDGRLEFNSLLALLVGGGLVGVIGGLLDALMGADYPMLDREYKERNGLA